MSLLQERANASPYLDSALRYAELGYSVLPIVEGRKTPLCKNGLLDATTDATQIEAWWTQWPNANIAIRTDGLFVIDVDPNADGSPNLWMMDQPDKLIDLACCPMETTPRGGRHYFFRQSSSDAAFRSKVGEIAPNVDHRADGGYIIVSPSQVNGKRYEWAPGMELDCKPSDLPELPEWFVEIVLEQLNGKPSSTRKTQSDSSSTIIEGRRNSALTSLAGTMRRVGMSEAEILAALHRANSDRCNPPLDDKEVEKIAWSVARYQPDSIATAIVEDVQQHDSSNITWFSEIERTEKKWLWFGRIPAGCITLIVGLPGCGKSFFTIDSSARVSTGASWPDGCECPQGSVILITAEDSPSDTIRPRLDAAGADVRRVGLLSMIKRVDEKGKLYEAMFSLADVATLEAELQRVPDCKLIVIDPIGSFLGGGIDSYKDNEVRSVLAPVAALAEKHGAAVLVVAHRRKGAGMIADDLALGSRAFTGLARAVWHVVPDPEDKLRRLFLPGKNNLAAELDGMAFTIEGDPPAVLWSSEPVKMNANECLAAELQKTPTGPKPVERARAEDFIREALARGPRLTSELEEEGREVHGLSQRTLRRARQALNVESYRPNNPGPWYLRMPQVQALVQQCAKVSELGQVGHVKESAEYSLAL